MRLIQGLTLGALLVGCADGVEDTRAVSIEWGQSSYESSTAGRSVGAVVTLGGTALPPDVAIDVRATQGGVVLDVPSKQPNRQRQVPLTLRPEADASGAYILTATTVVGGVVYSATTMFVVRE